MKKLNFLKILSVVGIAVMFFCSCKKPSNKLTTSNSVVGYWFGSFDGSINQSFLLRSDGTLKVYDFYFNPTSRDTSNAYDGTGTYSVSGNTLTTSTSFPNGQSFTGTATLNFNANPPTFTYTDGSVYTKQ